MPTFYLTIKNEQRNPLNGVIISNGQYNTSPVSWPSNDTTGPGGAWNGTSDSNGTIASDVKYTCPGQWSGTLQSSGFDDYPYTYNSGSVTGDFYDSVQMVANATTGANSQNSGANTNAGSLQNQTTASAGGVSLNAATATSNVTGGLTTAANSFGLYASVALVAIAIIAVVLLVIL